MTQAPSQTVSPETMQAIANLKDVYETLSVAYGMAHGWERAEWSADWRASTHRGAQLADYLDTSRTRGQELADWLGPQTPGAICSPDWHLNDQLAQLFASIRRLCEALGVDYEALQPQRWRNETWKRADSE